MYLFDAFSYYVPGYDTFTSFYSATGAHMAEALDVALKVQAIKNTFSVDIESWFSSHGLDCKDGVAPTGATQWSWERSVYPNSITKSQTILTDLPLG